ncbi:hypothetical protein EOL96_03520 [Candidatus Saccharibacteria bacterium]|nr:hypothetical protein [Candidatus Saccharibacteria bacterium]
MGETLTKRGEVTEGGTTVEEYTGEAPATETEVDVLQEALRKVGQDPDRVGASGFITLKPKIDEDGAEVVDENGNAVVVPTVTGLWIKTRTPGKAHAKDGLEDLAAQITPKSPRVYSVRTDYRRATKKDKTAAVWSDVQFGYRDIEGVMVPTHDPRALNVARQVIKYVQPDLLIDIGDALDLEALSHFKDDNRSKTLLRPTFAGFQRDVTAGFRADNPNARYVWLEGNHEKRWFKQIYDRFPELADVYNVSPEGALGAQALSLQAILHLEKLGIEFLEGYPANRFMINERLYAMHGDATKGKDNTTNHYLHRGDMPTKSFLSGHTHRNESASTRTRIDETTWVTREGHSFGALCKLDGTVAGITSGRRLNGSNVVSTPNWQHGIGIVEYKEGDEPFDVHHVRIHTEDGYRAKFGGNTFYPTCDEFGNPVK